MKDLSKPIIVKIKPMSFWKKRGFTINEKSIYSYFTVDNTKNVTRQERHLTVVNRHNSICALTKEQVECFIGKKAILETVGRTEEGLTYVTVKVHHDAYKNISRVSLMPIKARIYIDFTDLSFEEYFSGRMVLEGTNEEFMQVGPNFKIGYKVVSKEQILKMCEQLLHHFGYKITKQKVK